MKTLFIEAKSDTDIRIPDKELEKIPPKVGVVTTIQHLHKINDVMEQLPDAVLGGHIIGCSAASAVKIKDKVNVFLYIGSGRFHPLEVYMETEKDVFCYNPFTKKVSKITDEDFKDYNRFKKISMVKYLSADRVGILVSTKHGQNNIKAAEKLAEKKDKEYHIFAFDTLSDMDMENFPFIQCWVNTACPRIADERKNIINISDIQ